jgi:hypothetical protein
MFSLVSGLSSASSAGSLPPFVRMFRRYYPLYDSLPPCAWGLSLIAFPHRPATFRLRATTGPLGSRAWSFYTCVGSTTPREHSALALSCATLLPSGWGDTVGFPHFRFRSSIPSLHIPLSNASSATSRLHLHGSGPGWFATPFLYAFSFTTPRRFIPTLTSPEWVLPTHAASEPADFTGDRRSSGLAVTTFPGPEQAKCLPMPSNHGVGFDDDERSAPVTPYLR